MYYARQIVLVLHVVGGAVALMSMWLPLFSKKGGRLHVRAGKVYVGAMAVTCTSSFVASRLRIVDNPAKRESPLFLVLVGLLAAVATLWGMRILRQKKRTTPHRGAVEWVAAVLLVTSGVAAILYWVSGAMLLFLIFGLLCAWTGLGFLQVLRNPPKTKMFWWYEHLGGMLVACISTVTAFSVVNWAYAPQAFRDAVPGLAVWVTPGVIGGIAIAVLTRFYKQKLEPGLH